MVVTELLSDILSIDVYQLSDITDICVPAECHALLAGMGWLQAIVLYIYNGFRWNDIFVIDIWYQDTIIFSQSQLMLALA